MLLVYLVGCGLWSLGLVLIFAMVWVGRATWDDVKPQVSMLMGILVGALVPANAMITSLRLRRGESFESVGGEHGVNR